MLSLFFATCGQRWYPKLGREGKDDLPFVSWWLFKPQPYAIRHSKVDKCFGRVRVAYSSTFAQERCTIVECCLVAALVELRSGGVLPEHTEKKGWTSTQQIECHLYHHYAISTGASSRILRMEMFTGVFNTNLSCANKIETVRLFPLVILVMFEKTSVSSGHRWTEVRNQNLFRSLASGALNLLRVESDCLGRFLTPMLHSNEGHS